MWNNMDKIAAIVNLFFVAAIFLFDRYNSKKIKEASYKELWYSEVITKRLMDTIDSFYKESFETLKLAEKKIKESKTGSNTEALIEVTELFNIQIHAAKHVILPSIKIFSDLLYAQIKDELLEYQDTFTKNLEKSFKNSKVNPSYEHSIDASKCKVIKYLYAYQFKVSEK